MRSSCLSAELSSSVSIVHGMSCAKISSAVPDWVRSLADSNTAEAQKDESWGDNAVAKVQKNV